MRVVFTSLDGSHFQLMVPTAWALRTAGHEVRVLCKPDLADDVARSGLTAVPIECPPWYEALGDFEREAIAYYSTIDVTRDAAEHDTWEDHLAYESIIVPALNEPLNSDAMIDEVVAFARDWRPDLVIWETMCLAGPVAALAAGAAHARLVCGPELEMQVDTRRRFLRLAAGQHPAHREDPTREWLDRALERLSSAARFDETMLTGQWTIDTRPESMRAVIGVPVIPARYVPYNGPAVVPRWLREPPSRPRVCLTLGVSIDSSYELFDLETLMAALLETLGGFDVEVVAALSEQQRRHLPPVPGNVRLVERVPLHDLLPTCAAVVHHAGYQTKATAELHGVPQVVITGWEWVSEAMGVAYEKHGNLLAIPVRELSREVFADRMARILNDPSFTSEARRLRREMMRMPPPNDVVAEIEGLTLAHRRIGGEA